MLLLGTLALQFASLQRGIYVFGLAWMAVGAALAARRGRTPSGDVNAFDKSPHSTM